MYRPNHTNLYACSACNGKPVIQVNARAWHKALKQTGIENFSLAGLQAHLGKT
ncbi:hypothetical protein NTG1052_550030 [Candidatus Nitrotoga sp. 1052]|nr:hypothetical protein NTG1052_550030 [Candidatus Nitrotoga sp. 1052]